MKINRHIPRNQADFEITSKTIETAKELYSILHRNVRFGEVSWMRREGEKKPYGVRVSVNIGEQSRDVEFTVNEGVISLSGFTISGAFAAPNQYVSAPERAWQILKSAFESAATGEEFEKHLMGIASEGVWLGAPERMGWRAPTPGMLYTMEHMVRYQGGEAANLRALPDASRRFGPIPGDEENIIRLLRMPELFQKNVVFGYPLASSGQEIISPTPEKKFWKNFRLTSSQREVMLPVSGRISELPMRAPNASYGEIGRRMNVTFLGQGFPLAVGQMWLSPEMGAQEWAIPRIKQFKVEKSTIQQALEGLTNIKPIIKRPDVDEYVEEEQFGYGKNPFVELFRGVTQESVGPSLSAFDIARIRNVRLKLPRIWYESDVAKQLREIQFTRKESVYDPEKGFVEKTVKWSPFQIERGYGDEATIEVQYTLGAGLGKNIPVELKSQGIKATGMVDPTMFSIIRRMNAPGKITDVLLSVENIKMPAMTKANIVATTLGMMRQSEQYAELADVVGRLSGLRTDEKGYYILGNETDYGAVDRAFRMLYGLQTEPSQEYINQLFKGRKNLVGSEILGVKYEKGDVTREFANKVFDVIKEQTASWRSQYGYGYRPAHLKNVPLGPIVFGRDDLPLVNAAPIFSLIPADKERLAKIAPGLSESQIENLARYIGHDRERYGLPDLSDKLKRLRLVGQGDVMMALGDLELTSFTAPMVANFRPTYPATNPQVSMQFLAMADRLSRDALAAEEFIKRSVQDPERRQLSYWEIYMATRGKRIASMPFINVQDVDIARMMPRAKEIAAKETGIQEYLGDVEPPIRFQLMALRELVEEAAGGKPAMLKTPDGRVLESPHAVLVHEKTDRATGETVNAYPGRYVRAVTKLAAKDVTSATEIAVMGPLAEARRQFVYDPATGDVRKGLLESMMKTQPGGKYGGAMQMNPWLLAGEEMLGPGKLKHVYRTMKQKGMLPEDFKFNDMLEMVRRGDFYGVSTRYPTTQSSQISLRRFVSPEYLRERYGEEAFKGLDFPERLEDLPNEYLGVSPMHPIETRGDFDTDILVGLGVAAVEKVKEGGWRTAQRVRDAFKELQYKAATRAYRLAGGKNQYAANSDLLADVGMFAHPESEAPGWLEDMAKRIPFGESIAKQLHRIPLKKLTGVLFREFEAKKRMGTLYGPGVDFPNALLMLDKFANRMGFSETEIRRIIDTMGLEIEGSAVDLKRTTWEPLVKAMNAFITKSGELEVMVTPPKRYWSDEEGAFKEDYSTKSQQPFSTYLPRAVAETLLNRSKAGYPDTKALANLFASSPKEVDELSNAFDKASKAGSLSEATKIVSPYFKDRDVFDNTLFGFIFKARRTAALFERAGAKNIPVPGWLRNWAAQGFADVSAAFTLVGRGKSDIVAEPERAMKAMAKAGFPGASMMAAIIGSKDVPTDVGRFDLAKLIEERRNLIEEVDFDELPRSAIVRPSSLNRPVFDQVNTAIMEWYWREKLTEGNMRRAGLSEKDIKRVKDVMGPSLFNEFSQQATLMGKYYHRAVEEYLKPIAERYPDILRVETPVVSEKLGIRGTVDMFLDLQKLQGLMESKEGENAPGPLKEIWRHPEIKRMIKEGKRVAILDIKTMMKEKASEPELQQKLWSVVPQLTAYRALAYANLIGKDVADIPFEEIEQQTDALVALNPLPTKEAKAPFLEPAKKALASDPDAPSDVLLEEMTEKMDPKLAQSAFRSMLKYWRKLPSDVQIKTRQGYMRLNAMRYVFGDRAKGLPGAIDVLGATSLATAAYIGLPGMTNKAYVKAWREGRLTEQFKRLATLISDPVVAQYANAIEASVTDNDLWPVIAEKYGKSFTSAVEAMYQQANEVSMGSEGAAEAYKSGVEKTQEQVRRQIDASRASSSSAPPPPPPSGAWDEPPRGVPPDSGPPIDDAFGGAPPGGGPPPPPDPPFGAPPPPEGGGGGQGGRSNPWASVPGGMSFEEAARIHADAYARANFKARQEYKLSKQAETVPLAAISRSVSQEFGAFKTLRENVIQLARVLEEQKNVIEPGTEEFELLYRRTKEMRSVMSDLVSSFERNRDLLKGKEIIFDQEGVPIGDPRRQALRQARERIESVLGDRTARSAQSELDAALRVMQARLVTVTPQTPSRMQRFAAFARGESLRAQGWDFSGPMGGALGSIGFGLWNLQRINRWTFGNLTQWGSEYANVRLLENAALFEQTGLATMTPEYMQLRHSQVAFSWFSNRLGRRWLETYGSGLARVWEGLADAPEPVIGATVNAMSLLGAGVSGQIIASMMGFKGIGPIALAYAGAKKFAPYIGGAIAGLGASALAPIGNALWAMAGGGSMPMVATSGSAIGAYTVGSGAGAGFLATIGSTVVAPLAGALIGLGIGYAGKAGLEALGYDTGLPTKPGYTLVAGQYFVPDDVIKQAEQRKMAQFQAQMRSSDIEEVDKMLARKYKMREEEVAAVRLMFQRGWGGKQLTPEELERFVRTAAQLPGREKEMLSTWTDLSRYLGVVEGTDAYRKVTEQVSALPYSEQQQLLQAARIASVGVERQAWTPERALAESQLLQYQIRMGAPLVQVMTDFQRMQGYGPEYAAWNLPEGISGTWRARMLRATVGMNEDERRIYARFSQLAQPIAGQLDSRGYSGIEDVRSKLQKYVTSGLTLQEASELILAEQGVSPWAQAAGYTDLQYARSASARYYNRPASPLANQRFSTFYSVLGSMPLPDAEKARIEAQFGVSPPEPYMIQRIGSLAQTYISKGFGGLAAFRMAEANIGRLDEFQLRYASQAILGTDRFGWSLAAYESMRNLLPADDPRRHPNFRPAVDVAGNPWYLFNEWSMPGSGLEALGIPLRPMAEYQSKMNRINVQYGIAQASYNVANFQMQLGDIDFMYGAGGYLERQRAIQRAAQDKSFAVRWAQLGIQQQQLGLNIRAYGIQRRYQLAEREDTRLMQIMRREWSLEDLTRQGGRFERDFAWNLEDINRAIRYSSGRQRIDLMRQRERMLVRAEDQRGDMRRQRDRTEEINRIEDRRYKRAVEFEQDMHRIQMERFSLQQQSLDLQKQALADQEDAAKKMRKLEDERFEHERKKAEERKKHIEEILRLEKQRLELQKEWKPELLALRDYELMVMRQIANLLADLLGGDAPEPPPPGPYESRNKDEAEDTNKRPHGLIKSDKIRTMSGKRRAIAPTVGAKMTAPAAPVGMTNVTFVFKLDSREIARAQGTIDLHRTLHEIDLRL